MDLYKEWNAAWKQAAARLSKLDRQRGAERLRYEARVAFLDGRTARAKQLNSKADLLDAETRKAKS